MIRAKTQSFDIAGSFLTHISRTFATAIVETRSRSHLYIEALFPEK
ncbi:MAG: hypothetical protein HC903_21225 [Methylacidiphilales bacterium]|nr:hypothetical protein [Candidatus Methylacidiphilales bacterium]